MITAIILFAINDKYNLANWVVEIKETYKTDEIHNNETFVNKVRMAMLEGKEQFVLQHVGKSNNMEWFTREAIDMVYSIDDATTSGDYDYLRYKTVSINSQINGFANVMTVTYDFKYNESDTETEQVDKKISKLFQEWEIEKLSDYKKIKKIHDYIVDNASYDTSLERYSAYDNLINHNSTCQGYMTLAYKMLTEADIPCRVISGTGTGESHGWNIVKLKGKWYNLDCTWDDPLTWDGEDVRVYDYFLKSDKVFEDHKRDLEYRTAEFYKEYEMGESSYKE